MQIKPVLRGLVGLLLLTATGCGHSSDVSTNHASNSSATNARANATAEASATSATTNAPSPTSTRSTVAENSGSHSIKGASGGHAATTNNSAVSNTIQSSGGATPQLQSIMAPTIQKLLSHPHAGTPVDCSALVQYVYAQAGIKVPRTVSQQAKVGKPDEKSQLRYGDIVFFDLSSSPGTPTFDGIYVGNGQFVARTTHGIESIKINSVYWKDKFMYGEHVV